MRSNILEKYPSSDVRVYVVWFDMLPGDSRGLVDRKVLNDHRVANFYPNRVVGSWFAEHTGDAGIVWDGSLSTLATPASSGTPTSSMVLTRHGQMNRDHSSAPAGL